MDRRSGPQVTQEQSLKDEDYKALANFRYTLRQFMAFTEAEVAQSGLTPQQHQALLAIRTCEASEATVGYVAERLLLKPHSATGLIDRMVASGLVERGQSKLDRRQWALRLTPEALGLLDTLSEAHRDEIRRVRPLLIDIMQQIR